MKKEKIQTVKDVYFSILFFILYILVGKDIHVQEIQLVDTATLQLVPDGLQRSLTIDTYIHYIQIFF